MVETTLDEILARNDRHVQSLPDDQFDDVQSGQAPAAVSMCCSDSRVSQTGMVDAVDPGWLFTPSTIGNQVRDLVDGEWVIDGSVLYPIAHTGTRVALVVGHTGCGAVTAALEAVQSGASDQPAGIEKWVEALVPIVEDGLNDDRIDSERKASLVDQLVEYNVDRQVEFLRASGDVPDAVAVYGLVYDFQSVYGDTNGRLYLVNANGETDPATLRDQTGAEHSDHVRRLDEI
ncbi:carbonic anhydrase [Halococcoides cellulosivorans]|uniref:carbonic anhydrase n=1 Tax=Halococcoides cellulosivorans TaxID=1679096 RepID=A0A2R4WYA4_9EURY|nr:carbonic anhydrase [Halococcoides cellulosivorans]AWB26518.1 carbonic anhydrase [Halococcoides cellulosivorans]